MSRSAIFFDVVQKPTNACKPLYDLIGFFTIPNELNARSLINVKKKVDFFFCLFVTDDSAAYSYTFNRRTAGFVTVPANDARVGGDTDISPPFPRLYRQSISLIDPKFQFDTGLKWWEGDSIGPV